MARWAWIVGAAMVAGVGSAALAGALLWLSPERRHRALPFLVAFAAGTLLAAALLELLPEALAGADAHAVSATVLGGVLAFFALERWVVGQHCHEDDCDTHAALGPVVLLGDTFHNFVDGVAIAAAFRVSVPVGVVTAAAILTHEIPQEIGNVALLLHAGYAPSRAFSYNVAANSAAIVGAVAGGLLLDVTRAAIPYVLAVSAASFLYIAVADLMPGLHRARTGAGRWQPLALVAGVAVVAALHGATH